MSEQVTNNPDYLQHYPDAIQDPQKAHFIAEAGKEYEDHNAEIRKELSEAAMTSYNKISENDEQSVWYQRKLGPGHSVSTEVSLSRANRRLAENNARADDRYQVAAAAYDLIKNSKR